MKTTIIGSLIYGVLFAALTTVADAKPNTPKILGFTWNICRNWLLIENVAKID